MFEAISKVFLPDVRTEPAVFEVAPMSGRSKTMNSGYTASFGEVTQWLVVPLASLDGPIHPYRAVGKATPELCAHVHSRPYW